MYVVRSVSAFTVRAHLFSVTIYIMSLMRRVAFTYGKNIIELERTCPSGIKLPGRRLIRSAVLIMFFW